MTMTDQGWRAMTETDLDAVTAISDSVHGDFRESRDTYAERLALYPAGCRVFVQGGVVKGFIVAHPWHDDAAPDLDARLEALPQARDNFYLHDIALLPETRGSGAGRSATAFVVDHARAAGFDHISLVAVNGADSFWAAQGFENVTATTDGGPLPGYGAGTYFMRRGV